MRITVIARVLTAALLLTLPAASVGAEQAKVKNYGEKGKTVGVRASYGKDKKKSESEKSISKNNPSGPSKDSYPDNDNEPGIFNPDTSYEKGEVMVVDPPKGFSSAIRSMGYRIIETVEVTEMKMKVHRIRIPAGLNVPMAVNKLRRRYPRVEIDANHQFDPSAAAWFPKTASGAPAR